MMMLVVDVNKGIQTQTAECLVIGEIMCDILVVALNKIDQIPEDQRAQTIEKVTRGLAKTFATTKFGQVAVIPVAARPATGPAIGVENLIQVLAKSVPRQRHDSAAPFVFAVDHCFAIKGQGTVLTGTALSGQIQVNENIEIPTAKLSRKIKSIQMFHRPVQQITAGDRAGICVTQFDASTLERGYACAAGAVIFAHALIARVDKVRFFKLPVLSKSRFHVSMGHETVMGTASFFTRDGEGNARFEVDKEYAFAEELGRPPQENASNSGQPPAPLATFALIELDHPVACLSNALLIGSRLDLDPDVHTKACRLAFSGRVHEALTDKSYRETFLPKLKVFKRKSRTGTVERVRAPRVLVLPMGVFPHSQFAVLMPVLFCATTQTQILDDYTLIGKGLFKKETTLEPFLGLQVGLSSGEVGEIEGAFGQSGKFRVRMRQAVSDATKATLAASDKPKGKGKAPAPEAEAIEIVLSFKRYVYDRQKRMIQSKDE
ncbi:selenocysteine-specific elongation factor [Capsaspora owczarzaki ATCC 30864]|uniref:Selenocysteine-specific elongation factor n=1 Tax=Capsaspora owczarzaki (strain ATCC 30864) TaxID=595528 RepID=A0A0D2WNA0_CAPO3|nr:selenocysteine-specific elongation factor [Capsaspora owczarzaki ATCC 30864]